MSDFLMRVKSGRFPSIEKDMKMVLAHCGSLFLDPASLWQVRQHPSAIHPVCMFLLAACSYKECCNYYTIILSIPAVAPLSPECCLLYGKEYSAASGVIVAGVEDVVTALLKIAILELQVYHEVVVLERIHTNPHFSPGVSLEALTRPPLHLH